MVEDFDVTRLVQDFQDKALEVLHGMLEGDDPWFLYVPSHLVHGPIIPNEPWQGRSGLGPYGDFVLQFDDYVGQLVQAIDDAGQRENTIVIVTSDNGVSPVAGLPDLRAQGHDPSNGWRGAKADIWEGGHREPFIVRWPEVIDANTTSDHLISHSDVFATLSEALGEQLPETAAEDSVSQLPVWQGSDRAVRQDVVASSGGGGLAIRQGDWKLDCVTDGDGFQSLLAQPAGEEATRYQPAQLYNLADDPTETTNLLEEYPDKVAELAQLLAEYIRRGRSTPGAPQSNDAGTPTNRWMQIEWLDDADEVISQCRTHVS